MGRIIAASVQGGEIMFEKRKILIESIKQNSDLRAEFEVHFDGSMKGTKCKLRVSWKFAPVKISVHSIEGVAIPVNRLGGEILIPPRVTGFDSRRVSILAVWSEDQVKKIGDSLEFGLAISYEETNYETVLINSGRGISSDGIPDLAATSLEESNVLYVPLEVISYLARIRKRIFEDKSLHLDVGSEQNRPITSSEKYDFKGDFLGLSHDYDFVAIKRNNRGMPEIDIEVDDEMAAYLDDFLRVSSMDNSGMTKKEISERRKVIISMTNWFEERISNLDEDIPIDVQLILSIAMIRAGNSIGGRVGRKIIDAGIKLGSFVFDKKSAHFGEINDSIIVKGSNGYSSKCQIFTIIALIHIKSGGYKIKKVEFDELLGKYLEGLRYFRTQTGFFENLDHLFADKTPVEVDEEACYELSMAMDWVENINY